VQPKDRSMIESLCRDRGDVFFRPGGVAPADEYFQAWIGQGRAVVVTAASFCPLVD